MVNDPHSLVHLAYCVFGMLFGATALTVFYGLLNMTRVPSHAGRPGVARRYENAMDKSNVVPVVWVVLVVCVLVIVGAWL